MILFDIGNTDIKAAVAEEKIIEQVSINPDRNHSTEPIVGWKEKFPQHFENIFVASVNDEAYEWLIKVLENEGFPNPCRVTIDTHNIISHNLDTPQTTGIDRLLAARAALELTKKNGNDSCIIIDAGTAITVDIVMSSVFEGGVILPGSRMWLSSLAAGTSALPDMSMQAVICQIPGKSTSSAIGAGLAVGISGAVEKIVSSYRTLTIKEIPVFTTGGSADLICEWCNFDMKSCTNLVLEGLRIVAQESLS